MRPSLRSTGPALLISAAVSGLLCLWSVSQAPDSAWAAATAAVLLTAAVATALHAQRSALRLRQENNALTAQADRLTADALRATDDVRRAKDDIRQAAAETRLALEAAARSAAGQAAALSAGANAAGRMQALSTSMLADLREMENRHTDEDVLGDLLHLDHRTAQAGRLADSIAVLTGARSGRRWAKPIVMESILRGAMGRISGYQRVRLHSTSDVSIAGHAAEGVMHALAELLDNAANFSPPTAEVHVYVEEVPAGTVITVEDSGLVMSDVQLRRAERTVSTAPADLTGLSGTRLGLAVVGRLARKHGLTVSFRPSARGGTGALLMLPQSVITQLRPDAPGRGPVSARTPAVTPAATSTPRTPAAASAPPAVTPAPGRAGAEPAAAGRPAEPVTASAAAPDGPSDDAPAGPREPEQPALGSPGSPGLGESGLPRRRRGQTLAAAQQRTGETEAPPRTGAEPGGDPAGRAGRFSSFYQAVRTSSARPANPTHPEGNAP